MMEFVLNDRRYVKLVSRLPTLEGRKNFLLSAIAFLFIKIYLLALVIVAFPFVLLGKMVNEETLNKFLIGSRGRGSYGIGGYEPYWH